MKRKPPKGKSLAELNPLLAKEWHPIKNGDLTPYDVTVGSNIKVWWKCDKGDDHEWVSSISHRSNGRKCPVCSGKKTVLSNCLATLNPELAKQWHPTKNGSLTPYDVRPASGKKVWWKCDKGDDHEWIHSVNQRKQGLNCTICSGNKVVLSNCLSTLNPELAKQWHPTKNGDLTPYDVTIGSHKKVWWKCDKGDDHEWVSTIYHRSNGRSCAICAGQKVSLSSCLATLSPELAKQWHPTKNGKLTPFDVSIKSGKKVWWKCDKGDDHEWQAIIGGVSSGKGCPICSGNKVVLSNCLATLNPELAKQWHPTKNGDLTPYDVTIRSGKKVWWVCDKDNNHEWETTPHMRHKRNCPYCTLTPQSKQELIITFELLTLFNDINPKGFKTRINRKLWTIDIYIPQLHLGIEFDGSYWHKDKQALDKLKTEQLNEEGFNIIRVREEPLKKLSENDVISRLPYNGKKVTNDVLRQIIKMKKLDNRKLKLINNYLDKEGLQNEKGLDKYIDMILTQKGAT